jgi:hypothetical protein
MSDEDKFMKENVAYFTYRGQKMLKAHIPLITVNRPRNFRSKAPCLGSHIWIVKCTVMHMSVIVWAYNMPMWNGRFSCVLKPQSNSFVIV